MKDIILHPKNRFTWALLAFQGGYVNVGGLLSVHMFVSHVTGFAGLFGQELIYGRTMNALYFLLVPLFFLLGAFIGALMAEIKSAQAKPQVYLYVLSFMSFLYLAITVLGNLGVLGVFGEPFASFRDFVLLCILTLSCGMQNSLITHFSKAVIRTTHLTGITTDLGIGLAKWLVSKDKTESSLNRIRLDLILYFVFGSICGSAAFVRYEFWGFLIPAIISLVIGTRLFSNRTPKTRPS